MPIHTIKKITADLYLGIWQLEEDIASLSEKITLSPVDQERFNDIQNDRRKREFLAVRSLVKEMLGLEQAIFYTEVGKPYFQESDWQISISHCKNWVVVLLGKEAVGVDVEDLQRDLSRVQERFFHPKEKKYWKEQPLAFFQHLVWTAKEALFKIREETGISFRNELLVECDSKGEKAVGYFTRNDQTTSYQIQYVYLQQQAVVAVLRHKKLD